MWTAELISCSLPRFFTTSAGVDTSHCGTMFLKLQIWKSLWNIQLLILIMAMKELQMSVCILVVVSQLSVSYRIMFVFTLSFFCCRNPLLCSGWWGRRYSKSFVCAVFFFNMLWGYGSTAHRKVLVLVMPHTCCTHFVWKFMPPRSLWIRANPALVKFPEHGTSRISATPTASGVNIQN